jgi:outer membrane protein OmpA-like peptidoglycan-associated protein
MAEQSRRSESNGLAGGKDWSAKWQCKNSVTLTGTVDSEEALKQAKGAEAQALFGSDVSIDNQLSVQAPEPVAVVSPPQAAKLYFETGKTSLPNDSNVTLEPIVTWLNANPQAKAVISGYHDARGAAKRRMRS